MKLTSIFKYDVEITYNGKTEIFKERCIVDTF